MFGKQAGRHVSKQLSAYHHGELSVAESDRISDHLRECVRCRDEYEEIRFGALLASQLTRSEAPESLWTEIERELRRDDGRRALSSKWTTGKWAIGWPATAFATALLLVGIGVFWFYKRQPETTLPTVVDTGPSWEVTRLDGAPVIEAKPIAEKGRIAVGQMLATDRSSRAQISVGEIGEVKIEPESRIRMVSALETDHRLALERGKMEAFIWAPPGKFYVNTPSAVAIDLGCSYVLEVNDDGTGLLRVTMGWVAFEWEGRESFVPAGAMCITRPGPGPGIPYFEDASKELISAVSAFDLAGTDDAARLAALKTILSKARKKDALTLWHLLTRTNAGERNLVFDRLASFIPPPAGVKREGILGGDRAMLDTWWERLGYGDATWWRMWKGPVPSTR